MVAQLLTLPLAAGAQNLHLDFLATETDVITDFSMSFEYKYHKSCFILFYFIGIGYDLPFFRPRHAFKVSGLRTKRGGLGQ